MIESFWSTLPRELLGTRVWETPAGLGSAIFAWFEASYNPRRRHTSLEILAPVEYEDRHHLSQRQALHSASEGAA